MRSLFIVMFAIGCGDDGSHVDEDLACTPEARGVGGVAKTVESVFLDGNGGMQCPSRLLASSADVADAFANSTVPPQVAAVDFAVDRIVLGSSNPALQFAVDDGVALSVGIVPLCQGEAPTCVAYIVRSTIRDTLAVTNCPYTGPDPCNAP